jgi:CheY-like chemotaxis protein
MGTDAFSFERVMIIDDTTIDRYIAALVMNKVNFAKQIMEFDMATKAIDYLEQHQDEPEMLPQIILLDIRMPEMDGFEFLDRLEKVPHFRIQKCCIVMLSSSLSPTDHERAASSPAVRKFINKPLNKDDLEEIRLIYKENNAAQA